MGRMDPHSAEPTWEAVHNKIVVVHITPTVLMPPRLCSWRTLLRTTTMLKLLVLCFVISSILMVLCAVFTNDPSPTPRRHRSKLIPQWDRTDQLSGKNKRIEKPKDQVIHDENRIIMWDPSSLLSWVRSDPVCPPDLTVLILITSAPSHVQQRDAIRSTWCKHSAKITTHSSPNYRCIFLIGQDEFSSSDQYIQGEMAAYDDILYGTFLDRYRNLTNKVLMGLFWASTHCPATFVLKTDDDCFVSVGTLLRFLPLQAHTRLLYAGAVFKDKEKRIVVREPYNKWFVSLDDYQNDYYPAYASGTGYLLSRDVWQRLVDQLMYHKPFPNEDAFMGVVLSHGIANPLHSSRFAMMSAHWAKCNMRYLLVLHRVDVDRQNILQKMADQASEDCENTTFMTSWN